MNYPSKSKLKDSGLIFSGLVLIVFTLIPFLVHGKLNFIPIFIISPIVFLSFVSPFSLRKPYVLWVKFGELLGKINSKLILFIFFYLIISPAAIIRRIVRLLLFKKRAPNSNFQKPKSTLSNFNDLY